MAGKRHSLTAIVAALGVAQVISFGTLFFTIAVLGPALRDAAGVGDVVLYAMFSAGLVLSGLVAPRIGREIDRRGGRPVLAGGSLLAGVACVALAFVQGPITLLVAWLLVGVAMAATLYDAAFAALHHIAGGAYRRSVTAVTLYGGFASTVFWPLSQALLDTMGMRAAFLLYALLHFAVCLPLHVFFVPRLVTPPPAPVADGKHATKAAPMTRTFFWLATALSLASVIAASMAAHQIGLLTAAGLTAREAVLVGALIGPMQVIGRFMELMLARHVSAIATGTVAFAVFAVSLAIFAIASGGFALAVLFAMLYGWSNGVLTITRGTVPAELFGREGYGALLGRLAMPQFIARALAPAAFAVVLAVDPGQGIALGTLVGLGIAAILAYRRAVRAGAAHRVEEGEASR